MKTCKDCKVIKNKTDFYGIQGECKECTKKRVSINARKTNSDQRRQRYSYKRIFWHRYMGMKQRIDGKASRSYRVEGMSICSQKEFIEWCNSPNNYNSFHKLWKLWEKAGFPRNLTPSIDRIDNKGSYTLGNIQWLSLSANIKKK